MRVQLGALALVAVSFAHIGWAQDHWVGTWAAAPQQPRAAGAPGPAGITSLRDQTLRMIVRTSIGGSRVRVELSNAFGTAPLTLGPAHIALREKESAIVTGSDRALTFNGRATAWIPPGAHLLSDPVALDVPPVSDLAISVYVPAETAPQTMHAIGLHTTYISKAGDFTAAPGLTEPATSQSWYWITGVDVLAPARAAALVTFGDSITDGTTSTPDADKSWPSQLAKRLAANPATANIAVLNEGISGNRLLRDNAGPSALARFDRDVLARPGVRWVTLLEGINDIGRGLGPNPAAGEAVTADDVIGAMRQLIERAHSHGIRVIGCTLTPYGGAAYYSDAGEQIRQAVNRWILTGGAFDAVVDFDVVTRDAEHPLQIRPPFNIRDHLHPNDDGYKAMADAIDVGLFTKGQ